MDENKLGNKNPNARLIIDQYAESSLLDACGLVSNCDDCPVKTECQRADCNSLAIPRAISRFREIYNDYLNECKNIELIKKL